MKAITFLEVPRIVGARIGRSASASNFLWLAGDRGIRLLVGIVVGVWSARYLGKANFGIFNYVLGLTAMFMAPTPLGMEGLAVREIIQHPKRAGTSLGTVILFRAMASVVLSICCLTVLTLWLRPHDSLSFILAAYLVVGGIMQSLESGELLFQARTEMRRLVVPRFALFGLINVIKVALIINHFSLIWFGALTGFEMVMGGLITLTFLKRLLGDGGPMGIDWKWGQELLKQSWPLAIGAVAVIVYMKIGPIILGHYFDDASLGAYYAGIRIPDAAGFLPMILASSMLPGLMRRGPLSGENYREGLLHYFRINALMGYCICIPLSVGAPLIIHRLYGNTYAEAAPIMAVFVWSLLFIFMGVARGQHLINERMTTLPLFFSILTLAVNLGFNMVLIPRNGLIGAALATVLSQFCAGVACSFLFPRIWWVGRYQLLALATPWLALRRPS